MRAYTCNYRVWQVPVVLVLADRLHIDVQGDQVDSISVLSYNIGNVDGSFACHSLAGDQPSDSSCRIQIKYFDPYISKHNKEKHWMQIFTAIDVSTKSHFSTSLCKIIECCLMINSF